MDIPALITANTARWKAMTILPKRQHEVDVVAQRLCDRKPKAIYQQIAQQVWGKPDRWWFVAIVHEREASQDFSKGLAQGDPWNEISIHRPAGIGPFPDFVSAAVFALTRCAPFAGKWTDWTIGGVLTLWIFYNGIGYEKYHNEPSPYDWGATSVEQTGKYVADGVYNSTVWDTQVGCAAMLKAMMLIDSSIVVDGV